MKPTEMKKYQIIYADPPWSYSNFQGKGSSYGDVSRHYKTMAPKDISSLPIQTISDKDCMLFLWATFPNLPQAINLVKEWGFEYKTVGFVWIKTTKAGNIRMDGLGFYTMSNAEIVLIGRKGKYKRKNTGVKQIILYPRTSHSFKPPETRNRIVELCGDLLRIELFARQKTKGWNAIGYDLDGLDIKESLLKLT